MADVIERGMKVGGVEDVIAAPGNRTGGRSDQAGKRAHCSGLAAAIGSLQVDKATALYSEIEWFEQLPATAFQRQPVTFKTFRGACHPLC